MRNKSTVSSLVGLAEQVQQWLGSLASLEVLILVIQDNLIEVP